VVTIPLAPRTARAIDLAISERTEGPLFHAADGRRLDRHGAARIVRRVTQRAGVTKHVGPHTLRHAFITAALDAGVPLRDVQEAASHVDPRTTMRYAVPGRAWTGTPPTPSPPMSPGQQGSSQPRSKTAWPPSAARLSMPWPQPNDHQSFVTASDREPPICSSRKRSVAFH
jgi:hypothetical protein